MKLFEHPQIVISQKAKIIELTNEYKISDPEGNEIGVIRQEGQSTHEGGPFRFLARSVHDAHPRRLRRERGAKVLQLTRPRKIVKSSVKVTDGLDAEVGTIRQQNVFGKIRFGLEDAAGQEIGQIQAENWRAWNCDRRCRRYRGGAHHQDVGGLRQDDLHHRRRVPARHQPKGDGHAAVARLRRSRRGRHGAKAGRPRVELAGDGFAVPDGPSSIVERVVAHRVQT